MFKKMKHVSIVRFQCKNREVAIVGFDELLPCQLIPRRNAIKVRTIAGEKRAHLWAPAFIPSFTAIMYSSRKFSRTSGFESIRRYGPFSVVTSGQEGAY